jgi:3-oxoacyl-[acyl-carrier protein] reductase
VDIVGKTVIVTGAAGCLGRAIVEHLLDAGATVVACDRDADGLATLADGRDGVIPRTVDLTDAVAVEQAVTEATKQAGTIHALVNNAGAIRSCPLVRVMQKEDRLHPVDLWRDTLALNLDTVFNTTRAVADHMLRGRVKGTIVNVSSVASGGNAGQTAYSAAKAGVNAMTMVWARELGAMGIRCVAVSPGFIDTDSTHVALSDRAVDTLRQEIPLRRLGRAPDVASAVLHALANDYLTGKVLPVDGGMVI